MRYPVLLVSSLLLMACTDRPTPQVVEPPASHILSPADGDTVASNVLVRLSVTGARAVPADGTEQAGLGHHHLFVDVDLTPADSAIPKRPGIYHIGSGADTLTLEGLPPGRHRIIARFAYGDHVPMPGIATDTIWIVVQ